MTDEHLDNAPIVPTGADTGDTYRMTVDLKGRG